MAAAPGSGSLLGLLGKAGSGVRSAVKAKAAKSPALRHLLTVVALGVGDFVAWHYGLTAGGLATMGAILIADFKIQAG